MRRILLPLLLTVLITLACGATDNVSDKFQEGVTEVRQSSDTQDTLQVDFDTGAANLGELGMSLAKLGPFAARFEITFSGSTDWLYQVNTRFDGKRIEYKLHIEGVNSAQNPGDIRLVNVNGINRMKGPGTEDQCMQFPDEMETGLLFLDPVDFMNPQDFSSQWEEVGTQTVAGRETTIYQARQDQYRVWENVVVTFGAEWESQVLLSFSFEATGEDPLFGYGDGKITGQFTVLEIGYQEIKQVGGCKPIIPLPEDAEEIVILPGVTSFHTSMGPVSLSQFYEKQLLTQSWVQDSTEIKEVTQEGWLVYSNKTHQITIHVEANNPEDFSQGFLIKIYEEGQE